MMDNQSIDEMPAGRETDALVAEKVMGLEVVYPKTPSQYDCDVHFRAIGSDTKWLACKMLPYFSTDIAAAWEAVEKVNTIFAGDSDLSLRLFNKATKWEARWGGDFRCRLFIGNGDSAPLAICRAALKVVEGHAARPE